MSEYKGIKGFQVQTRTADPTPFAQALANNPYAGSWASGGNLNTGRSQLYCGDGIQTAGMVSSGNGVIANTELYDGSSWTEVNDLNTARYTGQATDKGTTSASLNFGGNPAGGSPHTTDICESWDGTNWTEGGTVITLQVNIT